MAFLHFLTLFFVVHFVAKRYILQQKCLGQNLMGTSQATQDIGPMWDASIGPIWGSNIGQY